MVAIKYLFRILSHHVQSADLPRFSCVQDNNGLTNWNVRRAARASHSAWSLLWTYIFLDGKYASIWKDFFKKSSSRRRMRWKWVLKKGTKIMLFLMLCGRLEFDKFSSSNTIHIWTTAADKVIISNIFTRCGKQWEKQLQCHKLFFP